MKFTISSASLASATQTVTNIVSDRPTMAILGGILITTGDGEVTFRTTDMTTSVSATMSADIEEPGEAVVSARMMRGIAKSLPDAVVEFGASDDVARLTCQKSKWSLRTLGVIDFPTWDDFDVVSKAAIPRMVLVDMVEMAYRVTSRDDSRPIFKSIHLKVSDGVTTINAADMYRMLTLSADVGIGELEANIPGVAFKTAMSAKSSADMVTIRSSDTQVSVEDGRFVHSTRLKIGDFPNMDMLMPKGYTTAIRADAVEFANALRRSSVIASVNPLVKVIVNEDALTVHASSPDQGESTETIPIEMDGEPLAIGLHHGRMLDCVGHVDGEIEMNMNGPMQPAVFRSYGDIDATYLLMPMKV